MIWFKMNNFLLTWVPIFLIEYNAGSGLPAQPLPAPSQLQVPTCGSGSSFGPELGTRVNGYENLALF